MNGKIPVFGAVASAYGFAFGHIGTVLRLSWLWLAVLAGLSIYWGPEIMAATVEAFKAGTPEAMQAAMSGVQGKSSLMQLVQFLASVIILVALVRVVISGDDRSGVPVHILSGMPDLRVIGVTILLIIAIVAAMFGLGIVIGILGAAKAGAVAGIVSLVFMALMIWVFLRLSLVLPVAAVESNLGVERSWSLMKGNSLRMLLAILIVFIPFGALVMFAFSAVMGPEAFQNLPKVDPQNPAAFQAAMMTWMGTFFERMQANFLPLTALQLVITLISNALWAGLLGRAYRATTGMEGE
jgi:hypothetical protein